MADYNPFSLEGKRILITGASSGIGRATAIECSKMGANVIVTGRNQARLDDTFSLFHGDGHSSVASDLTDDESLNILVSSIDKLDGVVLCAGIVKNYPIQFCSKKNFLPTLEINLLSQTELIRNLLKKKKLTNGSSVVAISSIASDMSSLGNAIYGAGKAALNSFMKYAAKEYAPKGIRFNCVSPAMVETPFIKGGALTDDQLDIDKSNYIGNRYASPEEVAWGAIYLLSEASSWVTGSNLIIDGGITL